MTRTERKFCDVCEEIALFTKEDLDNEIGEECLYCGWNNWKDYWNNDIETIGFDQTKEGWIDCRDGELNKQIYQEMNASERAKWNKIVRWTNKRFGLENKKDDWTPEEQNSAKTLEYAPYLFGGGAGLVLGLIIGLLFNRKR